jgi:hypothetical protein
LWPFPRTCSPFAHAALCGIAGACDHCAAASRPISMRKPRCIGRLHRACPQMPYSPPGCWNADDLNAEALKDVSGSAELSYADLGESKWKGVPLLRLTPMRQPNSGQSRFATLVALTPVRLQGGPFGMQSIYGDVNDHSDDDWPSPPSTISQGGMDPSWLRRTDGGSTRDLWGSDRGGGWRRAHPKIFTPF